MQSGLPGAHKRANAIRGCKPVSISSGAEGISSVEEETTASHPTVINIMEGDAFDDTATKASVEDSEEVPPEIFMQKNFSLGHLMPSEVLSVYFVTASIISLSFRQIPPFFFLIIIIYNRLKLS